MSVEIRVPEFGESVVEATVGPWRKRPGEAVGVGEAVVELETEKVSVEVAADAAGVLARIVRAEGETVRPGDVLGLIEEGRADEREDQERKASSPPAPQGPVGAPSEPGAEWKPTSPAARELASASGIDLAGIAGTGRGGRVTLADVARRVGEHAEPRHQGEATRGEPAAREAPPVVAAPSAPPPSTPPAADRQEQRIRLSRRRLTIARRLVEAQRMTASLTTFNEVDLTAVQDVRRRRGEAFRERHGVRLGFMSFFTKAAIGALKAYPQLNAEIQDDELVLKRYYDVGIAVSAEGGLVVPVVRDADRKSFAEIEREIADLAARARDDKLTLADLEGGTFTITNGGVFGSLLSTPILNPPQVGILGMHKVEDRPVVRDGQIVIRPMMYVALTYDHRVVDGREAVQFLVRVKDLIEDPEQLLLEV